MVSEEAHFQIVSSLEKCVFTNIRHLKPFSQMVTQTEAVLGQI